MKAGLVCRAAVTDGHAQWACNDPATKRLQMEYRGMLWQRDFCQSHYEQGYDDARSRFGSYPNVVDLTNESETP